MDEEKSDLRRAKEKVTKTGNEKTLGGGGLKDLRGGREG